MIHESLISAAAGIFTTVVAFLVGRRKRNAIARKTELEAVEKAISIWRQLATELKQEVAELKEQCQRLENTVEELRKENNRLQLEMIAVRNLKEA